MEMASTTLTLIIVLIAVILTLVVALIALFKAKKALEKSEGYRIERISKDVIRKYMGFEGGQQIRSIVHEELTKQQGKPVAQVPITQKPEPVAPASKSETAEPVKPVEEQPQETQDGHVEIVLPKPVTLFTGSYSTGAFRHITPVPDEKTVFTIYTDRADVEEGILNIDESAYAKVAQTPDYLRNACSYSGTGTQLRVVQTGKVIKENGAWVVKEPIIAEFN